MKPIIDRRKMSVQEEAQEKVARLLTMVCTDKTNPEAYEFVLAKLTRMTILGTLPAGCSPRSWSYKSVPPKSTDPNTEDDAPEKTGDEDFSAKKESFIAP